MRCDLVDTYTTFISTHICFTKEKYQIVEFVPFLANMMQHQQNSIIPEMRFSSTFGPHFDEKREPACCYKEKWIFPRYNANLDTFVLCKPHTKNHIDTTHNNNKLKNFGPHFDERESNWKQMKSWFSFWRAYFSTHRNISSSAKMNSCKPGTLWMKGHKSLWTLCDSYLKIACGKFLLSEKYVCHILIYSYIRIIILWSSIKDTHVPFLDLHLNMKRRRSAGPGR